jgi:hypothetical protein
VLVDTLGLVLAVMMTSAHGDDSAAAIDLLTQIRAQDLPRLAAIFGENK